MFNKHRSLWIYVILLIVANMSLALPTPNFLRVGGAVLLLTLLPGLSWSQRFFPTAPSILKWVLAAAISYSFTALLTLLLHYLAGPVLLWHLLLALNLFALIPLIKIDLDKSNLFTWDQPASMLLLILLVIACLLRLINLGYSEFQGDEALAMIAAAEALEGHEDALFLRSKGPSEVLFPMALWRLTGTINELTARLPFTLANLWSIVTIYLVGIKILPPSLQRKRGWPQLGLLAALFFALNGFTVAFARIVQYQALVVWMSSLAFLLALEWRHTRQHRYAFLSGVCLGGGLLAHYDAILVLPAIIWIYLPALHTESKFLLGQWLAKLKRAIFGPLPTFTLGAGLLALPFYIPFFRDPQANRTGEYVGNRIGDELRNNLPDFFHFNTFYSSFYFILITSLLVVSLLLWWMWRSRWGHGFMAVGLAATILGVAFRPDLLHTSFRDFSFLPFALLLAGAFLAFPLDKTSTARQALIVWLGVPFMGYLFVVALGLTHIYTIVPAWSLLAALAWQHFSNSSKSPNLQVSLIIFTLLSILSFLFLWNAFIRHDVEYWQDHPKGNLALFWTPYEKPPTAGFFGFAHRTGWKAVGQKIVSGELPGDYGSNEEPDVTTWYTRGAPRACDPLPEYYFLADDLIDPIEISDDIIATQYERVGQAILPNQKRMDLRQLQPTTTDLGRLDDTVLARQFDQSATPAAFARSARGAVDRYANFSNLIQLIGYDLDTRRAQPGGRVPVTLYWQALSPITVGYQVFTHIESEETGLIAQADGIPVCWTYPTDLWRPGQIIADQHAIPLPTDAPIGTYPLHIGLYLADTFERLDVLDEAGNPAGTSLVLDVVEIGR